MIKSLRFSHITIDRIVLGFDDLFSKRLSALKSFPYGIFVETGLNDVRGAIASLPEAAKGRPEAGPLAEADADHDGFGGALWHMIEAYRLAPDTTEEQLVLVNAVREAFGSLDDLTASYDTEAKVAKDRKGKIPDLIGGLQSIPLWNGKTLLDWANSYVAAGETIGELLSRRADAKDRQLAARLRSEAVRLLNLTRQELARARKKDPSLPAALDEDIFAFFDSLEKTSAQEAAEAKKKAGEKAAGTAAPVVPPAPGGNAGGTPGAATGGP